MAVRFLGDLGHLAAGRGRGERGHYRARGQSGDEFADLEVVRAEVVAPLEYAVGLVHGDQVDACGLAEEQEIVCEQAFGCGVLRRGPWRRCFGVASGSLRCR